MVGVDADSALQKLVRRSSKLPISERFMSSRFRVATEKLVPSEKTDEYSIGIYRTPIEMRYVKAFGSHFVSPAHQGGLINAVDFYSDEGLEIRAPAGGIVMEISEKFDEHGITTAYWDKGNGIKIDCGDGEYVWLEHLKQNFAKTLGITAGKEVKVGEIIGITGNTGFTENPHTHMEVLKFIGKNNTDERLDYKKYITKRIRFSKEDIPFDLYLEEEK